MRHAAKLSSLLSLRWHESGCPTFLQGAWGQDGAGTGYGQKEEKKSTVSHPMGFHHPSCHFHRALREDAPTNAATAIMQLRLVAALVEHPQSAAHSYRYREHCFTAEILSLGAPICFHTL